MTDDLYYRKLESISTSDLVDMLREKDRRIAELEEENEGLKAFESHCDEIEEDAKAIAQENAELKEQIERIRVTNFDVIKKLKEQIDELKAHCKAVDEVNEKMKCCQNCKHEAVHGVCVSPKKCTNLDKWELAE